MIIGLGYSELRLMPGASPFYVHFIEKLLFKPICGLGIRVYYMLDFILTLGLHIPLPPRLRFLNDRGRITNKCYGIISRI